MCILHSALHKDVYQPVHIQSSDVTYGFVTYGFGCHPAILNFLASQSIHVRPKLTKFNLLPENS